MNGYFIGIIVFIIGLFISRAIQAKANKFLSDENKKSLVDVFSKFNIFPMIFLLVMVGGFFAVIAFNILPLKTAYLILIISLIFYFAFSIYTNYSKLRKHHFPKEYINAYFLAAGIRIVSILAFFISSVLVKD